MPPTTEYGFTLPVGYVDEQGTHHRDGAMRLATARDEIEPQCDTRVRDNSAYLGVLRLARVLTRVGDIQPVTPALVERLYAADFAHLQSLYTQINSASPPQINSASPPQINSASPTPGGMAVDQTAIMPTQVPPVPPPSARPAALAGMSDAAMRWMLDGTPPTAAPTARPEQARAADPEQALPIGVRQDRERAIVREALMRSPAPPRRGRVLEGPDAQLPPTDPSVSGIGAPERGPSDAPLMRLATRAPANNSKSQFSPTHVPERAIAPTHTASEDHMEDIYEQMIARLRRELLVERERMGASPGA